MKLKKVALVFLGLILFVAILFGGVIAYLGTNSANQKILAASQKFLKEMGAEVSFSDGGIEILSGLHFSNLHFHMKNELQDITADIKEIRLKYTWSLLPVSVNVEEMQIEEPKIKAVITAGEKAEKPAKVPPAKPFSLDEFLSSPPLHFDLKNFALDKMKLDVVLKNEKGSTSLVCDGISSHMTTTLRPSELKGSLDWLIPNLCKASTPAIQAQFLGKNQVQWQIERKSGHWQLQVQSEGPQMEVDGIKMPGPGGADKQVGKVTVAGKAALEAQLFLKNGDMGIQIDSCTPNYDVGVLSVRGFGGAEVGKVLTNFKAECHDTLDVTLDTHVLGVKQALFPKPIDVEFKSQNKISKDFLKVSLDEEVQLSGSPVTKITGDLVRSPDGEMDVKAPFEVFLNKEWIKLSPSFKALGDMTQLKGNLDTHVRMTAPPSAGGAPDMEVKVKSDLQVGHKLVGLWGLSSEAEMRKTPTTMVATVSGDLDLKSENKKIFQLLWQSPLKFKADVNMDSATQNMKSEVAVGLEKAQVQGPQNITFDINKLSFSAKSTLAQKTIFNLEAFNFIMGDGLIFAKGDASGNLKTKDFQSHIDFGANFPKTFPEIAGKKISGLFEMPMAVTVDGGKEISFESDMHMKDFAFQQPNISVSGISGVIPVREKLIFKKGGLKFKEVLSLNPFERVDFDRWRPLVSTNDQQLTISKIQWFEKVYGPFLGIMSLRQNLFSVNQFDMDLGSGRAYGEMSFDAYPTHLQLGFLGRLSNLDMKEFLPAKFQKKMGTASQKISSRAGIVFNLKRNSLTGRIDVTEIGGEQLISMINVMDPNYEDDKMNKLRTALGLGYPTGVQMAFSEGFMDMDIDLQILGTGQRQSLRGVPVSGFTAKSTAEVVKKFEKLSSPEAKQEGVVE